MSKGMKLRAVVALAATFVMVLGIAVPAHAGPRVECVANGFVDLTPNTDGTWNWSVKGAGTCLDTLQGPYLTEFAGTGTSANLGLCSSNLFMSTLKVYPTVVLQNLRTLAVTTYKERWSAAITTFPMATPFLINYGPGTPGGGVILTRILGLLGNCPPAGVHTATFLWTQIS
jgi:hypothetical protein